MAARSRRRRRWPEPPSIGATDWAARASSRIDSYRSVVSRRGATPSSRSNSATSERYWRMAPARSSVRGEKLDEPPLAGLVERIELDAAPWRPRSPRPRRHPPPERAPAGRTGRRASVRRGRREPPASRRRPGCHGRRNRPGTARGRGPRPPRGPPAGPMPRALEVGQIDPGARRDRAPPASVDQQARARRPPTAARTASAAGPPGGLVIGLRPEHRRELVARERPALAGDQRDDRQRLSGVDHDRRAADGHLEWPEQPDPERWLRRDLGTA